jgi:hypothetical protein
VDARDSLRARRSSRPGSSGGRPPLARCLTPAYRDPLTTSTEGRRWARADLTGSCCLYWRSRRS